MECTVCGRMDVSDHGSHDPICPTCVAEGWVVALNNSGFPDIFNENDTETEGA